MELKIKFIDSSEVVLKNEEWDSISVKDGFLQVKKDFCTIYGIPKENILYYKMMEYQEKAQTMADRKRTEI